MGIRIVIIMLTSWALTGCISTKSYVDPAFALASYEDIASVPVKHNAMVVVEFQRNGKTLKRAQSEVENHVLRSLRATGTVNPVVEADIMISVVVNNVADMSEAATKGFGTGLTFGLAGTVVTDYYEISIEFTDDTGSLSKHTYKHAMHTTIGNKKAPIEDVAPTSLADGFGTIVEETILNFVKDMQSQQKLSKTVPGTKHECHSTKMIVWIQQTNMQVSV